MESKLQPQLASTYRLDIDGLRALAVTAVVAFHAFPEQFKGGFVGVDIFFVISGFLITGIVYEQAVNNRFSLRHFYAARIKRIFPALVFVLAACLGMGWAVQLENELRQLGLHAAAGAGFVANIALWREAGYFDQASELKPLLHLWSLGIEEQFYIFWPLLLLWFVRKKSPLFFYMGILLALSFMLSLALVETRQATAFFLPFPRFWELMAGGLLAFLVARKGLGNQRMEGESRGLTEAAATLGLALLLLSILFVDKHREFPGWWALPPVLGTVLLIGAGPQTWVSRHLLSHPWVVFIGLISYPLYLWHWPLLSFAAIASSGLPDQTTRLGLVALAVLLAVLTYRYVEQPIRRLPGNSPAHRVAIGALVVGVMGIGIAGIGLYRGGLDERLTGLRALSEARSDWAYPGDQQAYIPGKKQESVLFFGDSYIQQLYPRVAELTQHRQGEHRSVHFITASGCAPVPGIARKSDPACQRYEQQGFEQAAADHVSAIVLGGSWLGMLERGDYYDVEDPGRTPLDLGNTVYLKQVLSRLQTQLEHLTLLGKEVHVVLHPPGGGQADPLIIRNGRLHGDPRPEVKEISLADHLERTGAINQLIREVAENAGAHVIDPAEWVCNREKCRFTDAGGIPFYKDATHFRASFVRCCVKTFDEIIAPGRGPSRPYISASYPGPGPFSGP